METIYVIIFICFLLSWRLAIRRLQTPLIFNPNKFTRNDINLINNYHAKKIDNKIPQNTRKHHLVSMIINHGKIIERVYEKANGKRYKIKNRFQKIR